MCCVLFCIITLDTVELIAKSKPGLRIIQTWTLTKLLNNLDQHQPEDKQRRSQTKEEALSKAN